MQEKENNNTLDDNKNDLVENEQQEYKAINYDDILLYGEVIKETIKEYDDKKNNADKKYSIISFLLQIPFLIFIIFLISGFDLFAIFFIIPVGIIFTLYIPSSYIGHFIASMQSGKFADYIVSDGIIDSDNKLAKKQFADEYTKFKKGRYALLNYIGLLCSFLVMYGMYLFDEESYRYEDDMPDVQRNVIMETYIKLKGGKIKTKEEEIDKSRIILDGVEKKYGKKFEVIKSQDYDLANGIKLKDEEGNEFWGYIDYNGEYKDDDYMQYYMYPQYLQYVRGFLEGKYKNKVSIDAIDINDDLDDVFTSQKITEIYPLELSMTYKNIEISLSEDVLNGKSKDEVTKDIAILFAKNKIPVFMKIKFVKSDSYKYKKKPELKNIYYDEYDKNYYFYSVGLEFGGKTYEKDKYHFYVNDDNRYFVN